MATIAKFIGINKYIDPRIRDLTGARRDAVALWALFKDSVKEINAELTVDQEATSIKVAEVIMRTLDEAKGDDRVILFFSGHGTNNHRLAVHDTAVNDIDGTTVSMDLLAELFKKSKAGIIFCVLDCCFSGGTSAKVIEESPVPKNGSNVLEDLAGKGRVILAASQANSPSYEVPGTGHGLLTKALIDVLQDGDDEVISLSTAMDKVLEIVRVEAGRIGVTQVPVLLDYTEGIKLPRLAAGKEFALNFPEKQGFKVSKAIKDLLKFGIPSEVVSRWNSLFTDGLNNLQIQAVNDFKVLDGESLLVIAPTSSGKTFIGEMATINAIGEGSKSVFLLPYKALVNEKYEQFLDTYSDDLGYRVVRCSGDYLDQIDQYIKGKYDIAFLTYEMFLSLSVAMPFTFNNIGLVVLDEGQFITDPNRGIGVELILTYLLAQEQFGVKPQKIVLSATIGEANDFERWLGCKKLVSNERPVPLVEGVMDRSGTYLYKDSGGNRKQEELLSPGQIVVRRQKPSSQDMIVPLVKQLVDKGEKVLVFRNQRGNAQGCALYLARDLGLQADNDSMAELPDYDLSTTSKDLRTCLGGGVAFHTSNLTREERLVVERYFRREDSNIRVLVATTTVAAGINTPASTVILAEQEFLGEDGRAFTVAECKNMAGRAGRLGFKEKGKAIILANNSHEQNVLFDRYVLGSPENLKSSFDKGHLDTWVIRLLAQVKKVEEKSIITLLLNTYGGFLASRDNPDWKKNTQIEINELLKKMEELGLVEKEGDEVSLTLLGKACGQSALSFKSTLRLVEILKSLQNLNPETLMAVVQMLPESDESYTPMMRRGRLESRNVSGASSRFEADIIRLFQRYAGDEFVYFARCKRAAILSDWIRGVAMDQIESRYTANPYQGRISHGDIRRFADLTRFHLRSAHQIALLIYPDQSIDEESMDRLMKQLEVGIPEEGVGLLEVPLQLTRGEYLVMIKNGILNKEQLKSKGFEGLKNLLDESRAKEIIDFFDSDNGQTKRSEEKG